MRETKQRQQQQQPRRESIKNELDHLIIHETYSSDTIETLKEKIALMDGQKYEKERDIDLLRQSLRILGSMKNKKKGAPFPSMNLLIGTPNVWNVHNTF
ncbi:hypothetical protein YC2023_039502 [Brassica napus]